MAGLMFHHDSRDYQTAASDAARLMRDKLARRIEQGRPKAQAAIERVFREVPKDGLVEGREMEFGPRSDGKALEVCYRGEVVTAVHRHALGQMTEPHRGLRPYVSALMEPGDPDLADLAALNLNALFSRDTEKHLVRVVDGGEGARETRGFLSTKYRRLHPGALLEAFQAGASSVGAVPYEAVCTDTKFMVKAVCAELVEPLPDEVLALGVVLHESPFGNGATEVSPFVERMWCTNTAVRTQELRKVHLGARLTEGVVWSDETVVADTKALGLAIRDLVRAQMGPEFRAKLCDGVRKAAAAEIKPTELDAWLKRHLTKEEVKGVCEAFLAPDVQNMPAGQNLWRASNAISWFAHSVADEERKFELGKLAGQILDRA